MAVDMTQGGQFALIPAKVLYDDQLPATAKLLYGEIYRLSSARGYCYATNRELMKICGCSDPTVTRLIAALKGRGHIRVAMVRRLGGGDGPIQRRIFVGQELAKDDPEVPGEGPLKNEDTPHQKRLDPPSKMIGGPLKNEDTTFKKKNNKKDNNITPISPKDLSAEVEAYADGDTELQEAIEGLLENRAAHRNPVKTLRALNGILNKLDRLAGKNRAAKLLMLENAVTHNWATVYPLKDDELKAAKGGGVSEEDWDVC